MNLTKKVELNKNINDYLYKKYNILYHDNILNFYKNYNIFLENLKNIHKDSFDINEKILIEYFDTDFYDNSLKVGLHIRNIIECLKSADIPFFTVIFITHNYNLDQELGILINKEKEGFPIVLKTISSDLTLVKEYKKINLEFSIKKPAVCLMGGSKRSHRHSLYNFFKNKNLFDKISVNYKNEQ